MNLTFTQKMGHPLDESYSINHRPKGFSRWKWKELHKTLFLKETVMKFIVEVTNYNNRRPKIEGNETKKLRPKGVPRWKWNKLQNDQTKLYKNNK